jgi:hypothetical protein
MADILDLTDLFAEITLDREKLRIIPSNRSGSILCYNAYQYKVDYRAKTTSKITWRCTEVASCKARCSTMGEEFGPVTMGEHEHCHASQPAKIEVRATINELFVKDTFYLCIFSYLRTLINIFTH